MKLNAELQEVEIQGEVLSQAATIEVTAESFRILSADLYKDPIRAVMREIATNAQDANKGKPITIHLPTQFEPTFEVHDNGGGIPPERIADVYLSYFGSTKRDDVVAAGYFGLGSKSPLAYGAKNFTVISRYNSIATTYAIHLSTEGIPTISKLGSTHTNQPDGLSVLVPVKASDIARFVTTAGEIYQHFNPRPTFNFDIAFKDDPIWIDGGDFYLIEGGASLYNAARSLYAIMGPVCYKIDDYEFSGILGKLPIKACDLYIRAPMGSLRPTPSRESISLDEASRTYIKGVLAKAHDHVRKLVDLEVDKCKGLADYFHLPPWIRKDSLDLKRGDLKFDWGYGGNSVLLHTGSAYVKRYRDGNYFQPKRRKVLDYEPAYGIAFNDTKVPVTDHHFDLTQDCVIFLEDKLLAQKVADAVGKPLLYMSDFRVKKPRSSNPRDHKPYYVKRIYPYQNPVTITKAELNKPFYYYVEKYADQSTHELLVEAKILEAWDTYAFTQQSLKEARNTKKYGTLLNSLTIKNKLEDYFASVPIKKLVTLDLYISEALLKELKGKNTNFERIVKQTNDNKTLIALANILHKMTGKSPIEIMNLYTEYPLLGSHSGLEKDYALYILAKEGILK